MIGNGPLSARSLHLRGLAIAEFMGDTMYRTPPHSIATPRHLEHTVLNGEITGCIGVDNSNNIYALA
jgi:hypothetical protein